MFSGTGKSVVGQAFLAVAVLAAAVALVAGCGDSDSDSGSDSGSAGGMIDSSDLSKEQFIMQAGKACREEASDLFEEISTYLAEGEKKGLPQGVLVAGMGRDVLVPTVEKEIAAIRKIGAPEGEEEQVEEILAAQEAAAQRVSRLKQVQATEEIEDEYFEATELLHEYGFEDCVHSS